MVNSKRISIFPAFQSIRSFVLAQNYYAILAIVVLVVAIRLPIDYSRIMYYADGDFSSHIYYALDLLYHRPVPAHILAHSLWHMSLVFMWWLSRCRIDFWQTTIGLQVVSSIASALIIYFWFGSIPGKPSAWVRAFWAVTLVFVTPIIAPKLLDGAYFFGYIGLADYHNPTVHVLRPFALLMFIVAMEVLNCPKHSWWVVASSAILIASATYLKPSITITLLPALGVLVLAWLIRRKSIDWWLLILGIGIPAAVVLGIQYYITYVGDPGSKIVFMPLAAASSLSGFLGIKFLMSIFFPLAISLIMLRWAFREPEMILAWLGFAIAAAQWFLLAESIRLTHGNFQWGAQINLFLLFAATIRFMMKQKYDLKRLTRPQDWFQYAVYLPHIVSGVAYYLFCFTTVHYG